MIEYDVVPYSAPWQRLRAGTPTASAADLVMTPARWEISAQAETYADLLASERLHGQVELERISTHATRQGHLLEPIGAEAYAARRNVALRQPGFCMTRNRLYGATPDRFVLDARGRVRKGLEVKCPQRHQFLRLRNARRAKPGYLPGEYIGQCHFAMMVCDLDEWDLVLYHPEWHDYPEIFTVQRDLEREAKLRAALHQVLRRRNATVAGERGWRRRTARQGGRRCAAATPRLAPVVSLATSRA